MLTTVLVVPGGLLLLVVVALGILFMRTARGRRLLVPFKRRIPPRVRVRAKRILAIATGGKLLLPAHPPLRQA